MFTHAKLLNSIIQQMTETNLFDGKHYIDIQ